MKFIKFWMIFCVFTQTAFLYASTSFVTYNIRTFDHKSNSTNKEELLSIFNKLNADFITVEEIVNANSFKEFVSTKLKNYNLYLSRCGGAGRQKIGFMYAKRKYKLLKAYEDHRLANPNNSSTKGCGRLRPALVGHFQEIKTRRKFTVIGLHLKAGSSLTSYDQRAVQYNLMEELVYELKKEGRRDIILMGDLNTTGYNKGDIDYRNFSEMLRKIDAQTASKSLKCSSYWSGLDINDNKEESSLLDHIVFEKGFLGSRYSKTKLHSFCQKLRCREVSSLTLGIQYKEVSDHCPVKVEFY